MVHVDDVASAHIFLLNHPDAKGRYICSSTQASLHELSDFLSARYPNFQIPTREWVQTAFTLLAWFNRNCCVRELYSTWTCFFAFSFVFPLAFYRDLKDVEGHDVCGLSSKKLLSCGFEYKCGLGEMFDDAVQSYKERGLLWSVLGFVIFVLCVTSLWMI